MHGGGHEAVARCTEGMQTGIEWLSGVQRGHGVVVKCTKGVWRGIEWLLGMQRGTWQGWPGVQRVHGGV